MNILQFIQINPWWSAFFVVVVGVTLMTCAEAIGNGLKRRKKLKE